MTALPVTLYGVAIPGETTHIVKWMRHLGKLSALCGAHFKPKDVSSPKALFGSGNCKECMTHASMRYPTEKINRW